MTRFGDRRRGLVGLLGGSFNPAHAGHLHVARAALRGLGLDQVWLLVSPGNPLKNGVGMAPFAERLASARGIADGRRIVATGIEAVWGTRFTADTLRELQRRFPRVKFVWLMGADNLGQLPRWDRWRRIVGAVPIAVLPRPGETRRALAGQAVSVMRHSRVGRGVVCCGAPAWTWLPVRENPLSATELRAHLGDRS